MTLIAIGAATGIVAVIGFRREFLDLHYLSVVLAGYLVALPRLSIGTAIVQRGATRRALSQFCFWKTVKRTTVCHHPRFFQLGLWWWTAQRASATAKLFDLRWMLLDTPLVSFTSLSRFFFMLPPIGGSHGIKVIDRHGALDGMIILRHHTPTRDLIGF